MTDNRWAEPEGYKEKPPVVAYRILDRDSGEVVIRQTTATEDPHRRGASYLAFDGRDQVFADEIIALVQRVCSFFYQKDDYAPMGGWEPSTASDDEVKARIRRLNLGENTREAERVGRHAYPLDELPWAQQRALIEQIDRLKAKWQFEIVGENDTAVEAPAPAWSGPTPAYF